MKTQILKHGKWWLITAILAVALMAVSLSFCAWDDYSLKSVAESGKTGNYADAPDWSNIVKDASGNALTAKPKVGDIVTYGKYYQTTGATTPTAQRWRVVNIANNEFTLLAEKVVVYGNFWGNGSGATNYFHDYYRSTLRAWLNSGRDSVTGNVISNVIGNENKRDDGVGSQFSGSAEKQANKGFLDVAFGDAEKSILVPKNISGMKGRAKDSNADGYIFTTRSTNKTSINDLVWVPSWSEIFGTTTTPWGTTIDGSPSTQFEYFKGKVAYNTSNSILASGATDYAWNSYNTIASYYNNGVGSRNGSQGATWWWLRSPYPTNCTYSLVVNTGGSGHRAYTNTSRGGVRPAVCVQL